MIYETPKIEKHLNKLGLRSQHSGEAVVLFNEESITLMGLGEHGLFVVTEKTWLPLDGDLCLKFLEVLSTIGISPVSIHQSFRQCEVFVNTDDCTYFFDLEKNTILSLPGKFDAFYLNMALSISEAEITVCSMELPKMHKIKWTRNPDAPVQVVGVTKGELVVRHKRDLCKISFKAQNEFDILSLPAHVGQRPLTATLKPWKPTSHSELDFCLKSCDLLSEAVDSSLLLRDVKNDEYVQILGDHALVLKYTNGSYIFTSYKR